MKIDTRVATVMAVLLGLVQPLSWSVRFRSSETQLCSYVPVPDPSALIQLYFAASNSKSFDDTKGIVNMVVKGPRGQQLHSIVGQSHAEITLKPLEAGEHSICFTHGAAATEKTLDLDVALTNADGSPFIISQKDDQGNVLTQVTADAATQGLEKSVGKLNKDLAEISHTLKYLKNREKRNMETVDNIDKLIFYFSFFETLLIVGMSICQVAILRHFFGRSGRPRV